MKKTRHILSLALVIVLLLGLMAGCSKDPVAETSTPETSAPETKAPVTDDSISDSLFPLDEEVTLTFWWGGFEGANFGLTSPSEILASQVVAERTNISIEYFACSSDAASSQASIMYASNDYPDMILATTNPNTQYPGGAERAAEDGIFIYLDDIIEEYAPNYSAIRDEDEAVAKDTITESGNIIAIYDLYKTRQPAWAGLLVREDYLTELNMEAPVTYDDWYDMLFAFKTEIGVEWPFRLASSGYDNYYTLMAGRGVTWTWYQVDGEVKYGPLQDGYREHLTMLNEWYEAGFINPDFISAEFIGENDFLSETYGSGWGLHTFPTSLKAKSDNPDFSMIGVKEPVEKEGEVTHIGQFNSRVRARYVAISTACKNPTLALQWLDYFFSEDGAILLNYGVEGETFEYVNGEPEYTELISNNPDGYSLNNALGRYIQGGPSIRLQDWTTTLSIQNQNSIDCYTTWDHDGAYLYPTSATPTADENSTLSNIMAEVETYVNEMTLRFILGEATMSDAAWDEYINVIIGRDIETALGIKQAALNRYNAR